MRHFFAPIFKASSGCRSVDAERSCHRNDTLLLRWRGRASDPETVPVMPRLTRNSPIREKRSRATSAHFVCRLRAQRNAIAHVLSAWVFAIVVAPCLHSFAHSNDHEHGADGFSIRWHKRTKRDALRDHHLAHQQRRAHHHDSESLSRGGYGSAAPAALSPPLHTTGAAGHFAVTVLATPVFWVPTPSAATVLLGFLPRPSQPLPQFGFDVARPRGPPRS